MRHATSRTAASLLVSMLSAAGLSAQTWQVIGTPSNDNAGAYWNSVSDDNATASAVCNVGAVLTNAPALSAATCSNQAPVFLPRAAGLTTADVYLGGIGGSQPGAFRFPGGTYRFIAQFGRIAGDPETRWGIITDAGVVLNSSQLTAGATTVTGPFAFWITVSRPLPVVGAMYSSAMRVGSGGIAGLATTSNQQFALFASATLATATSLSTDTFGTIVSTGGGWGSYFIGMEDNVNGGRGFDATIPGPLSDRDYNDVMIQVLIEPEPSTTALFAGGALLLAVLLRRRRTAR